MLVLMLSIRRHFEPARSVSDKKRKVARAYFFLLRGCSRLAQRRKYLPTKTPVKDCPKKNWEVGEEVHRRSLREKFPNRCPSRIAQRRNSEVCEEVHRRSLRENFPTDVRRRLPKEEIRKLAKKSIENRCEPTINEIF